MHTVTIIYDIWNNNDIKVRFKIAKQKCRLLIFP